MSQEINPERVQQLLNGVTPGKWRVTDGPYANSPAGVYAEGEDGAQPYLGTVYTGEGESRRLLSPWKHLRNAGLMAASKEIAHAYLALHARAEAAEAREAGLREALEALSDWAVRERQEAWEAEKEAHAAGLIPGYLDWPHRKGAALHHLVGRISDILKPEVYVVELIRPLEMPEELSQVAAQQEGQG